MFLRLTKEEYDVAFHHRTSKLTSSQVRPTSIPKRLAASAKAITTCAIVANAGARVFFGHAFCDPLDPFCRRTGRDIAFHNALNTMKLSVSDYNDLSGQFYTFNNKTPRLKREPLTAEQVEELYAAGAAKRLLRRTGKAA